MDPIQKPSSRSLTLERALERKEVFRSAVRESGFDEKLRILRQMQQTYVDLTGQSRCVWPLSEVTV